MKYLIDTNIISELTKPSPDVKAVEWIKNQDTDNFYISVMSIGEIEFGIKKLPESHRRSILERFLRDKLLNWFSGRIMIIDKEVMDVWSDIMALSEKAGKKLATADALIHLGKKTT